MAAQHLHRPVLGMSIMAIAVLYLPVMDGLAKYLGLSISVGQIVLFRFALQCLFLLPFMIYFGIAIWPYGTLWLQIARALMMLITTLMFFTALLYLPMADSISIFFIEPMLVTILSALLLGEVIRLRRVSTIILGFVGALLIVQPHFLAVGWVALLPLGAALTFALYIILTRRLVRDTHPMQMQFMVGFVSVISLLLLTAGSYAFDEGAWLGGMFSLSVVNGFQLGLLLLIGVVATSGHLLIATAMRYAPANVIAPLQYLEIVGATIIGLLFFGDVPTGNTMLGIGMIVVAGLYLFYREHQVAAKEAVIKN